jgi:Thrombospondin type 3 repeat
MSRATGITTAAILLGSLALAAGPARAASVDIGKTASAMFPAAAAETYYECEQGSGPSYTVPSGYGVITKWFVNNTAASPGEARLKVFRRLNLTTHFVRGESEIENVLASTLASFPTRVTVQAGDQIGISTQGSVGTIYADGGATGNVACLFNGDPAVGSTPNQSGGNTTVLVNVRAIVETDFDGDGFGDDTQDADDDNDGIPDASDPAPLFADSDLDGAGNAPDNCPTTANADQADTDGDAQGDACDADDDNDGIPDASDPAPLFADSDLDGAGNAADNCPTTANANQADADRDSSGDACDPDDDNDGLTDSDEARRRTSRVDRDSDDDGLRDDVEVRARLNPAQRDSDRDGLTDGLERGLRRGVPDPAGAVAGTNLRRFRRDLNPRSNTNPRRRDTDHDGLADGREDRNHNGRVDRGETNPLHRDRRPRL